MAGRRADPLHSPELRTLTGLSITSVRRAVEQLQKDGILIGHPGKGVFVKALPDDADRGRADLGAIAEQVAGLSERVQGYDDLRAKVNLLEAVVMNLCTRLNVEYPHGGARDTTEKAHRRGRAGRMVAPRSSTSRHGRPAASVTSARRPLRSRGHGLTSG